MQTEGSASSVLRMDETQLTTIPASHAPYTDLDDLLNESDAVWATLAPVEDDAERPDTVDAMNAQILAGLVSP